MVEVFKTTVSETSQCESLILQIEDAFNDYKVNFDLDDCDNILRVECKNGSVQSSNVISFLKGLGYNAQVLPDG
ncbi:MAG TPA: hypothetical protein VGB63_11505 [Pedobacter sp.]|jgi:hypothetical protein